MFDIIKSHSKSLLNYYWKFVFYQMIGLKIIILKDTLK